MEIINVIFEEYSLKTKLPTLNKIIFNKKGIVEDILENVSFDTIDNVSDNFKETIKVNGYLIFYMEKPIISGNWIPIKLYGITKDYKITTIFDVQKSDYIVYDKNKLNIRVEDVDNFIQLLIENKDYYNFFKFFANKKILADIFYIDNENQRNILHRIKKEEKPDIKFNYNYSAFRNTYLSLCNNFKQFLPLFKKFYKSLKLLDHTKKNTLIFTTLQFLYFENKRDLSNILSFKDELKFEDEYLNFLQSHMNFKINYERAIFNSDYLSNYCVVDYDLENLLISNVSNITEDAFQLVDKSKIKKITIKDTSIKELNYNIFQGMINLNSIIIDGCHIRELHPSIFSNLPNLEYIKIKDTRIQYFPENLFDNLPHLKTLIIHSNYIQELPSNIFDSLINLRSLEFNGNLIKNFSYILFKKLNNLTRLSIIGEKLEMIVPGTFDILSSLKILSISRNKHLTYIQSNTFNLPNLKKLTLISNRIVEIEKDAFDLYSLVELNIKYNSVEIEEKIDENYFENVPRNLLILCKNKREEKDGNEDSD